MASRSLARTREADEQRAADTATAAEIAEQFAGWSVWSSGDGKTRAATRTGDQKTPADDDIWARTLLASDWDDLVQQLKVQSQHDAERTYAEAKA